MNALEKYITLHEQLLSDNIKLSSFDNHYYNTLPKEDKELILIDLKKGKYHTILLNSSIKVGVIGYIPTKMDPKIGFLQIIIDPKYRSKGIFSKSIKLLAKEHDLKEVWSTIKKDNIVSIKAHLKDGFKQFSEDKLEQWREVYLLDPDEVRLYKKFSNKEHNLETKFMKFPHDELIDLLRRLKHNKSIYTIRVSNERNKYRADDVVKTNISKDLLIVKDVTSIHDIKKYKFYNELSLKQKEEILKYDPPYEVIELIKKDLD